MGLNLGAVGGYVAPYFSSVPSLVQLRSSGLALVGNATNRYWNVGVSQDLPIPYGAVALVKSSVSNYSYFLVCLGVAPASASVTRGEYLYFMYTDYNSNGSVSGASSSVTTHTGAYSYNTLNNTYVAVTAGSLLQVSNSRLSEVSSDIPVFESQQAAIDYFATLSSDTVTGVIVDTTTVSVPAELPADTPYGGLTIPDAISGTAPAIADVIEQGVTDRMQPAVIPVTVDIPADIEITDDGIITENPVTVTPEMALPSVADLSLPASVIASFKTKFPFCLPWDVMAFFQPLSVTPQAPVIRCGLPDPFTGKTYEIVVDLSPWDGVAAIVRHFESVIIAVGFALGFRKFVLIGAHS